MSGTDRCDLKKALKEDIKHQVSPKENEPGSLMSLMSPALASGFLTPSAT